MKRIRIKKEIALVWAVTTNGHEEPLAGRNLSLFLVDPKYRKTAKTFHIENGNEVHFRVYPSEQPFTGVYTLELWENLGGQDQTVVDKRSAFELVNFTPQECDGSVDDIHAAEVFIGSGNLAVGIHGRGIVSVTKVSEDPDDWNYRILYDDGATEIIQIARGEKGLTDEEHAELIAETLAAKSAAQSANAAAANASQKAAEAAEAAQTANDAAEAANAAKEAADAATEAAQEATAAANAAKTAANNAATLANNAAANANTKAALAQAAADATNAAIAAASTATAAANAATAAANTAAEAANTAAATANSAASNASAKATLANDAAVAANAAKDAANSAASAANAAAALANDAAARAEAAILTIENKIERVELVCEDDQHITRKGSSVALTYDEVKALVDDPKNFVTLRYLDMFWMLPSYDDGGAIMFTSSGIEFGHVVVTRVILNTDGQMNNYSIIAEDADHKTDDMSKETAMDGHLTYPTTRAVNGEVNGLGNIIARSITSTPTEQTFAGTRVTAGGAAIGDGAAYISRVKGKTVKAWQMWRNENGIMGAFVTARAYLTYTKTERGYKMVANTSTTMSNSLAIGTWSWLNRVYNHKYLVAINVKENTFAADWLFQISGSGSLFLKEKGWHCGIMTVTTEGAVAFYLASRAIQCTTGETLEYEDWLCVDLTALGIDNLTTEDQIAQYYGFGNWAEFASSSMFAKLMSYSETPKLVPSRVEGVRTTGRNLWDGSLEIGGINTSTGAETPGTEYYRTKFVRIPEGKKLYLLAPSSLQYGRFAWYDGQKNFISYNGTSNYLNRVVTPPANACYLRSLVVKTLWDASTKIMGVFVSDTPVDYEPYEVHERKWGETIRKYFPDGMKSAGAVFDEFTAKKVTKRIGVVDLGTLTYSASTTAANTFYTKIPSGKPSENGVIANLLSPIYTAEVSVAGPLANNLGCKFMSLNNNAYFRNDAYTDAAAFKAAMSGVLLFFELSEPIVTDIPELPMWYEAWNGGTEEAITAEESAPLVAEIGYNENPATALNLL